MCGVRLLNAGVVYMREVRRGNGKGRHMDVDVVPKGGGEGGKLLSLINTS